MSSMTVFINNIKKELDRISGLSGCALCRIQLLEKTVHVFVSDILEEYQNQEDEDEQI